MNIVHSNAEIKKKIQFETNFVPETLKRKFLLKNFTYATPSFKAIKKYSNVNLPNLIRNITSYHIIILQYKQITVVSYQITILKWIINVCCYCEISAIICGVKNYTTNGKKITKPWNK